MAYTINKTDGGIVATITDGTVDTTTSLQLFGRSYSGFGEGLNENLVKLLENSSSTAAPTAPLTGELWFDASSSQIKVYDGTNWKPTGSAKSQSAQPSSASAGDLWHDSDDDQMYFYTGSAWQLLGPVYTKGQTLSGWKIETVQDASANNYVISSMYAGNVQVAIASGSAQFTPVPAISGFATIKPGLNLNSTLAGSVFNGNTTSAQFVDVSSTTNTDATTIAGGNFVRADANDITTGSLQINNDTGLIIGATSGSDAFEISRTSGDVTVANSNVGKSLSITTKSSDGSTTLTPINITSTGLGEIALTGDVTITGNLNITGEYNTKSSVVSTYDDAFIKLNTDNSEADAGVIVETAGAGEGARVFYDVSENHWTAGEDGTYSQIIRLADLTDDGNANKGTKGLTTDASSGNLKVTTLTLGAVGSAIVYTDTSNTNVPTIGQVATLSNEWGGSEKTVSTSAPTGSDGSDGDFWFVREA